MSQSSKNEMIVSEGMAVTPSAKAMSLFGDLGYQNQMSNFTGDKFAMLSQTIRGMNGDSRPGADLVGKQFTFVNWFAHVVELTEQKTGEVNNAVRIVLISSTGEQISFVSEGVRACLGVILDHFGLGELGDGITVEIQSRTTASKRKVLLLQPILKI